MRPDLRHEVLYQSIDELSPNRSNPRTHSKKQIRQLADSIQQFGFVNPVLVDASAHIIAGHGRMEAAKLLGITHVPTVRLDHMTGAQRRAYALADNRLAELAGWDAELLAVELQYLSDVDFDVTITGFDVAEIDLLLQPHADPDDDPATEQLPPIGSAQEVISRSGDLWVLGRHRLLCGDARDEKTYRALLGDERADIVFTDPPYNVPIANHVSGLGRIQHREFAMASGEMSEADFTQFLGTAFGHCAKFSRDGSIHFIFIDWRHLLELLTVGRGVYTELKGLCVWAKANAGMGSLYRSQHELVAVFKNGTAPHVNNIELGRHGRHRSNVWTYAGMNSFGAERAEALATHPTVKPVALVADALLDCSRRGAIVLDPFVGSGTTIIAAERTSRCAHAIEIDPLYVDAAVRRYEAHTGDTAVHGETGLTFRETLDQRVAPAAKTEGKRNSSPRGDQDDDPAIGRSAGHRKVESGDAGQPLSARRPGGRGMKSAAATLQPRRRAVAKVSRRELRKAGDG
jgi:DNA modification methylase